MKRAEGGRQRLLGLLGLARRAGKVILGTVAVREALRLRKAALLLLADDLAEGSAERITQLARAVGIPVVRPCSKSELSAALGRDNLGVVAVTDPALARSIQEAAQSAAPPEESDQPG